MSYSDLLKDPRWQRKRLEVMEAAGFACELCRATDKTLNVHHAKYVRGRKPWEYDRSELHCLCEGCHRSEHGIQTATEKREQAERIASEWQFKTRIDKWRAEHPEGAALMDRMTDARARMSIGSEAEKDAALTEYVELIPQLSKHNPPRVWVRS